MSLIAAAAEPSFAVPVLLLDISLLALRRGLCPWMPWMWPLQRRLSGQGFLQF